MLPSIRCSLLFPTSGRALGLTLKCNSLTALLLLLILKKTLGTNSRRILRIYFFSSFEQEFTNKKRKKVLSSTMGSKFPFNNEMNAILNCNNDNTGR